MYELTLLFLYDDKLQWSDALNRLVLGLFHHVKNKREWFAEFQPKREADGRISKLKKKFLFGLQDDVAPIPGTVDANVEVLVWTDLSYIDSFHQLVQHPHVETDVLKYVATVVHAVCLIGPRDNFSFTIILSLCRNILIDFIGGFDFFKSHVFKN